MYIQVTWDYSMLTLYFVLSLGWPLPSCDFAWSAWQNNIFHLHDPYKHVNHILQHWWWKVTIVTWSALYIVLRGNFIFQEIGQFLTQLFIHWNLMHICECIYCNFENYRKSVFNGHFGISTIWHYFTYIQRLSLNYMGLVFLGPHLQLVPIERSYVLCPALIHSILKRSSIVYLS